LKDDKDLKFLLKGSQLLKVKSGSWRKERFYKLQEDCKTIWQESKKMLRSPESQIFSIEDIRDVRSGHKTEGMEKYAKDVPEYRCFSIIFKDQRKNLDLIASSEDDANHWISGLGKIIAHSNSMNQKQKLQHWIHTCLRKADKNKDNKMSLKELKNFLKEVNIEVDDYHAKKIFQNLVRFLYETQQEEDAVVAAPALIQRYEPNERAKRGNAMTKDGFLMYLLSDDGNIFNSSHRKVYQDMTQPLSHYLVSSSHNTYLMEDQLTGPSSTEAYI
ncbi:unnamed protein product, partial [Bubo scandiacus]